MVAHDLLWVGAQSSAGDLGARCGVAAAGAELRLCTQASTPGLAGLSKCSACLGYTGIYPAVQLQQLQQSLAKLQTTVIS
jgi:hypothetical protein